MAECNEWLSTPHRCSHCHISTPDDFHLLQPIDACNPDEHPILDGRCPRFRHIKSCDEFRAMFHFQLVQFEGPLSLQICPSIEQFDLVYTAFLQGMYSKQTCLLKDSTTLYVVETLKHNTHGVAWKLFECIIRNVGSKLDKVKIPRLVLCRETG